MQAILITAYKNFDQLKSLVELLKDKFLVYIHIDRRSDMVKRAMEEWKDDHVMIISKYRITWGSINHLFSIIDLIKLALQAEPSYIHIISGQDYPIKDVGYFKECFSSDNRKIYLSLIPTKDIPDHIKCRYQYYNLFQKFNNKNKVIKCMNASSLKLQKVIGIKRHHIGEFEYIYKGAVWGTLPQEAAKYAVDYADDHPEFMKDLYYCYIPEEFFFQTILMNSIYVEYVVPESLRYSDWKYRNGSNPAYLDLTDYDNLINSKALFARKIHPLISKDLLDKIHRELLNEA